MQAPSTRKLEYGSQPVETVTIRCALPFRFLKGVRGEAPAGANGGWPPFGVKLP